MYFLIFAKTNTGKVDQKLTKVGEDVRNIAASEISLNIPVKM